MAIEPIKSPLAGGPLEDEDDFETLGEEAIEDPLDDEEHREEVEERKPAPRPKAATVEENLINQIDDIKLARYIDQQDLDTIGMEVLREYRLDERSRVDWETDAEKALHMAMQKVKPKQYPWPGASSFIYPLISQAAYEFAARTYPAMIQGRNVVKGVVWGSDDGTPVIQNGQPLMQDGANGQQQPVWLIPPGAKQQRANRIGAHMSWQLLNEMPEWEPQTDTLLHQSAVVGGAIRKTFRDHVENQNCSRFVSLLNIVWNYHAPSFEGVPRISEKRLLYPYEILNYERTYDEEDPNDEDIGGMFLPQDYGPASVDGDGQKYDGKPLVSDGQDEDAPHLFIDQSCRLDLDGDGYPEPYIVTVHYRSGKVVRIIANYDKDGIKASDDGNEIYKIDRDEIYTLYRFLPSLDGGSYPTGFGHLLRPLNSGINTTINQMFDAGTLQNSGGGFVSDQLGVPSGQTLFRVGQFTRVTTKGAAIRDSVFPIPFPGPSSTLFQLLGTLVAGAKEMASLGNILTGDAAIANAPPTTVLALIEQGMKFYTAIIKRMFGAEKQELSKLFRLNGKYVTDRTEFNSGDAAMAVEAGDYQQGGGVEPVADPSMVTDMQKLVRGQVLIEFKDDPYLDPRKIRKRFLESANIEQVDDLFAQPDPQAAQLKQAMEQIAMAKAQAEVGAERAKEMKDQTQAFLNIALARKNASAQEETFIEAQLDFLRLHIEALNTQVKAAAVDHSFHQTNMMSTTASADRAARSAENERQRLHDMSMASQQPQGTGGEGVTAPTPGPTGEFPTPPAAPVGPDVTSAHSPGTGNTNVPGDLEGAGPSGPPAQAIPTGGQ